MKMDSVSSRAQWGRGEAHSRPLLLSLSYSPLSLDPIVLLHGERERVREREREREREKVVVVGGRRHLHLVPLGPP
jgi:hypothetical protein